MTAEKIKQLMADNLTWVGSWSDVDDDYPLLEKHVIDSLGMVKLIGVLEEEFGIEIDDNGPDRDRNFEIRAASTSAVLTAARRSIGGTESPVIAEIRERIDARRADEIDVRALAAVTAVRATERHELLAAKAHCTPPPVAGLNCNSCFVDESHTGARA